MEEITSLMLQQALAQGLGDRIDAKIFQTEAVSNVLGNVVTAINEARQATNNAINNLQQKAADVQSEAADLKNATAQLDKIEDSMKEALQDKFGPATLPQQDMTAEQEEPPAPAPDAGITPPPDMGAVPPAPDAGMMPPPNMGAMPPDAGAVPPAPDAGMMPPPDMTQIDPAMLGALQPRF